MTPIEVQTLLAEGISAAQVGHQVKARDLLLKVVDVDPECENAWIWLSSVVETNEEKRICLENALTLNPKNEHAMRGLRKLTQAAQESSDRVKPSNDLIPARQPLEQTTSRLRPQTPQNHRIAHPTPTLADDIWERDIRLCAFCAAEIESNTRRCPACRRKLIISSYRYSPASVDLTIYWVLLIGVVQLYLVQILLRFLVEGNLGPAIWPAVVMIGMIFLIFGVMLRRLWAYIGSIIALLLILTAMIFDWFIAVRPEQVLEASIKANFIQAIAANPYLTLGSPLLKFIRPLQFGAVLLALLYGLFKVAPDFARDTSQLAAVVRRGLSAPSEYFLAGREASAKEMWASAVLHWRRAAALEPSRFQYVRHLGEAYARVGHYRRSRDVLESARRLTNDPSARDEIDQLLAMLPADEDA